MKRVWLSMVVALVASVTIFSGTASGQEPEPTTTTVPEPTTTTTEFFATTTTEVQPTPTTLLDVPLPGEHINDGSMTLGARFKTKVDANCQLQGSLAGQEMNLVRNETGNIGAVYGKADIGGGTAGLLLVQLGPLPTAVVAYRTTGACNQDVIGVGGYGSSPTTATFQGIGFGAFPGDFADFVTAEVTVSNAGGEPNLDLQAATDFLTAPR